MRTGILPSERIAESFWTTREERIVEEHYPKGRSLACLPHLPGRTKAAIRQRAHLLRADGRL